MHKQKIKKLTTLVFLCVLFLLLPAGCANNGGKVDTLLTLDSSCAGERSMKVTLPGIDLNGESGLTMDALLNEACPKELSFSKEADGYRFVLRFDSYEDYTGKLSALLGREPEVVFAMPDTVLLSGCRLREDFDSSQLFGWLMQEADARGLSFRAGGGLSCGSTAVTLEGHTQTSTARIGVSAVTGFPLDAIDLSTTRRADGSYDRTIVFSIPRKTTNALGDDLISYMNARTARGAQASWEDFPSGRRYTVRFEKLSLDDLKKATNLLFNSQLTGTLSYGKNPDEALPFTDNSAFEETLDLSGYAASNGNSVQLTYRYEVEGGAERVSVQTMEEGVWKQQAASSTDGTCEITQRAERLRVRIPEETVYSLQKTAVTLSCLGGGSFERTVDFLFAADGTQGAQFAADYFTARAAGAEVSVTATEEGPVCRLTVRGNAEELTVQLTALFGEGNVITYQSEGGAAEIHRNTSMSDTLHMAHLYDTGHEKAPITYTIQTNGQEQLDQLEHKSETYSAKVRLDQGQDGRVTFDLHSGDTEIVYNGNTPNWFGVTLALLGAAAAIVLAVLLALYVRKKGGKLPPPDAPPPEHDPDETIEDILADI